MYINKVIRVDNFQFSGSIILYDIRMIMTYAIIYSIYYRCIYSEYDHNYDILSLEELVAIANKLHVLHDVLSIATIKEHIFLLCFLFMISFCFITPDSILSISI